MAIECPVCREPIPWYKLFISTAWSRWECKRCESTLAVNVARRMFAVLLALAVMGATRMLMRVPADWEVPLLVASMLVVFVPYFMFFERARVVERRGFRCRQCGYDLTGQVDPRCPECGLSFNDDEIARMKRLGRAEDAAMPTRRKRDAMAVVGVCLVLLLATLVALGFTAWYRFTPAARPTPTPTAQPQAPAPPATPP